MTTTQTTTALALAEQELKNRFKNAKKQINPYTSQTHYPERNELEKELRELLEYEFNDWKSHHRNRYSWKPKNPLTPAQLLHKQETLSLFKSAFDWDTNYEMEVGYETYPNECSHTYEIKDEAELKEYIFNNKEIYGNLDEPSSDQMNGGVDINYEVADETNRNFHINISNFRLKGQEVAKQ